MITTVQISNATNKVISQMTHKNMAEAETHVASMRIAQQHSVFSFEDKSGNVVKVVGNARKA